MDRLLYRVFLLLPAFLPFARAIQAQKEADKIAIALEKAGINKTDARILSAELDAVAALYKQLTDSTIAYNLLIQYQKHYQNIGNIISERKIKPDAIMAAFPPSKQMLSSATMRIVKQKIAEIEASDESVKFQKAFFAFENELTQSEFAVKSRRYDAMMQEYLKKIELWRKNNPEFESFFLDLKLTVNGLNEVHKSLQNGTEVQNIKISKDFRAAVKRLRNVDFHHDNEFIDKFKISSLVERTIATAEFLCDNVK